MGLKILKKIPNPLKHFKKYKVPHKYKTTFKRTLKDRKKIRKIIDLKYSYYARKFFRGFHKSFTWNKKISHTVSPMHSGKRDGELMEEAGKLRLTELSTFDKFKDLMRDITGKNIVDIREPATPNIPLLDALLVGAKPEDNLALEIKTSIGYKGEEFAECLVNSNDDTEKIIKNSGKNIIIILGQNGSQRTSLALKDKKKDDDKDEEKEDFCFNGHCLLVDGRFERLKDTNKKSKDGRSIYKMYGFPFDMKPYTFKI